MSTPLWCGTHWRGECPEWCAPCRRYAEARPAPEPPAAAPTPEAPTVTRAAFLADPAAALARAQREGPLTLLGQDGEPRARITSSERVPVEGEEPKR